MQLQEIGPRFTLKLRSLKKGIPAVYNLGEAPAPLTLEIDEGDPVEAAPEQKADDEEEGAAPAEDEPQNKPSKTVPPKQNEVLWAWKVSISLFPTHKDVY